MKRRLLALWSASIMALVAVALAGCGSSGGESSTDSSAKSSKGASSEGASKEANATVAKYSKPITKWPGPNTPVTPPPGEKITVITCGSTGITCVRVANGAVAAAKVLGYEVNVIDGKNDPSVWSSAIQQAVASGANGIVLAAVPPELVSQQIKAARAQGVFVASALSDKGKEVVHFLLDQNRAETAEITAAYVADETSGEGHIMLVRDKEFSGTETYFNDFTKALPKFCPNCQIEDTVNFTLALAAQRLPGSVASSLQTHPNIDTVMLPFDAISPFVVQGITQAGKKGQVAIVGADADPPGIEQIEEGNMVASVGLPAEWMGWQTVDALVRLFANKPVEYAPIVQRMITKEDLPLPEGWQGDYPYQKEYERLWGK